MKPPPMALPQPVPVGERYLLIRRLAVGGVADIFLARQSATAGFEKDVVIKRLRPELRSNSRAVRMFLEEARIGALLNHPNVVHVYDVDVADGAPYIAMEYIVGGELGTLCRRGLAQKKFLPLEHAVELMRQAAAGLGYLHAKRSTDGQALQICHRDLSPNNLLVTEDGFLKIIDFGIAKTWRSDAAADRVLPGKLGYLSPEQVARTAVDQRTDIFSLGVVLYEITLGRRLFKGPAHEVVRMIREHVVEPPTFVRRSYPPALEEIVMRALSPAPARRYQSAYDLADDLEQFLQDAKLSSGPVRIARYLDELAHAEGGSRRPELVSSTGRFSRVDLDLEAAPFRSFRAAPGREWDDAEEPVADVASALGIDVSELRAMRVPPAEPKGEAAGQPVSAVSSPVSAVSSPVSAVSSPVSAAVSSPVSSPVASPVASVSSPVASVSAAVASVSAAVASPVSAPVTETAPEVNVDSKRTVNPDVVSGDSLAPTSAAKPAADSDGPDDDAKTDREVATVDEVRPIAGSARPLAPIDSGAATFGAAFIHRAAPPRSRFLVVAVLVALLLFFLYMTAC